MTRKTEIFQKKKTFFSEAWQKIFEVLGCQNEA